MIGPDGKLWAAAAAASTAAAAAPLAFWNSEVMRMAWHCMGPSQKKQKEKKIRGRVPGEAQGDVMHEDDVCVRVSIGRETERERERERDGWKGSLSYEEKTQVLLLACLRFCLGRGGRSLIAALSLDCSHV